jgi:DUF971 family protein
MTDMPKDIKVSKADRTITIQWADDTVRTYPARAVRCACPCAGCVDEHTGEPILDPATVPDDITIDQVELVGRYGLTFVWSDGHSTGIYTWERMEGMPTVD